MGGEDGWNILKISTFYEPSSHSISFGPKHTALNEQFNNLI